MDPMDLSVMARGEEQRQLEIQCQQSMPLAFPHPHFAAMYIDHRGKLQVETSPSITGYEKIVFTNNVQDRFLDVASGKWQSNNQNVNAEMLEQTEQSNKRRLQHATSNPIHAWEPPSPTPSIKRSTFRVGQTKLLRAYYEKAFDCFHQLNCRVIAKAFVKLVEPRKQVSHPYNGKKTVAGSTQTLDPESTKPKWWPSGVKHKEPDHLIKPERIRLLVHILCELKDSHGITAEKLKDAGQDVRRQIVPALKLQVLDELYYVRAMEELYLDGKLSSDTAIHVYHVDMQEEIQEHALSNPTTMPIQRRSGDRSRELPRIWEDAYPQSFKNNKRRADSEKGYLLSPAPSPALSRKSSLERSAPVYSGIDPTMMSVTEPPRPSPTVPLCLPPTPGSASIPDPFAHQFATQSAGHAAYSGYWDASPTVHPQFAFSAY
ncbi:hypothetical protein BJX99DRAFT_269764 [Aspergillus californicus]